MFTMIFNVYVGVAIPATVPCCKEHPGHCVSHTVLALFPGECHFSCTNYHRSWPISSLTCVVYLIAEIVVFVYIFLESFDYL